MGLNETLNSTDSVVINPVNSVSSSSTISNNSADDELTNLTWLQDNNLLQNMTHNDIISSDSSTKLTNQKEDNENVSPSKPSLNKDHIKEVDLKNNTIITSSGATLPCSVPPVKYNPHLHTQTKPPYSFSSLIFMAIESSPCKALPVKEIYNWITKNFPYYEKVPEGWKNTVRHNLSLNKCFKKIEKGSKVLANADGEDKKLLDEQLASKGSLWCVDQNLRPNLLQSIKRTPAHIYPYMSTAKEGTNLVQIGNAISDNQPNVNTITTVSIGNNNISPSNNLVNQSPKKVIALEKLPQKNILTTKRILIPITKVGQAGREAEEADAAESMLTLTQCSTAGALNNGNIFILTNKGNSLVPIQLNSITPKPVATVVTNKQQPVINKNPIAIITRPILTANASTSHPTIIQPTITKIQSINKQTTTAATATKASPINAINVSQLSTDHNYFSRASSVKTINSVNNVITIPASCLASGQKIFVNRTTANNATTNFIPIASNNLVNSNKTVNKIITITTNPTNQVTKTTQIPITKNIIIKSPVKSPAKAAIVEKKTTTGDKKRKSDSNDELMKMGAEALFNLANGTVKSTKASDKSKETGKQTEGNKNEKTQSKTRTITIHNVTSTVASSTPSTTTLTRSAAKKLKTTS